jgi:hypothetical protein
MMVDIRSITGSSHPSHLEQGTEQESTSHSRVGRSRQMNTHSATTTVVATAAIITATVMPPGARPKAMLEAACQVLHNPPGLQASSSAVEQ